MLTTIVYVLSLVFLAKDASSQESTCDMPIDCCWGDWSLLSACDSSDREVYYRDIQRQPACGGRACAGEQYLVNSPCGAALDVSTSCTVMNNPTQMTTTTIKMNQTTPGGVLVTTTERITTTMGQVITTASPQPTTTLQPMDGCPPWGFDVIRKKIKEVTPIYTPPEVDEFIGIVRDGPKYFAKHVRRMHLTRRKALPRKIKRFMQEEQMDDVSVRETCDGLDRTGRMPSKLDQDKSVAQTLMDEGIDPGTVVDISSAVIDANLGRLINLVIRKASGFADILGPYISDAIPTVTLAEGVQAPSFDFSTLMNRATSTVADTPDEVDQFADMINAVPDVAIKIFARMTNQERSDFLRDLPQLIRDGGMNTTKLDEDMGKVKKSCNNKMSPSFELTQRTVDNMIQNQMDTGFALDLSQKLLDNPSYVYALPMAYKKITERMPPSSLSGPDPFNCKRVDCVVSNYGPYSSCDKNGYKHRSRSITTQPSCGGASCPFTLDSVKC